MLRQLRFPKTYIADSPICLFRIDRKEEAEEGPGLAGDDFAAAAIAANDVFVAALDRFYFRTRVFCVAQILVGATTFVCMSNTNCE